MTKGLRGVQPTEKNTPILLGEGKSKISRKGQFQILASWMPKGEKRGKKKLLPTLIT